MSTVSESLSQLEVLVVDCQATAAAPHGRVDWIFERHTDQEAAPETDLKSSYVVTPVSPRNSESGRGDWIRTSDPLRPRQVRYQAALRPDSSAIIPRCLLPRT